MVQFTGGHLKGPTPKGAIMTPSVSLIAATDGSFQFGAMLDASWDRLEDRIGPTPLPRGRVLESITAGAETLGRVLIESTFDPLVFCFGVFFLFVHNHLLAVELGARAHRRGHVRDDASLRV